MVRENCFTVKEKSEFFFLFWKVGTQWKQAYNQLKIHQKSTLVHFDGANIRKLSVIVNKPSLISIFLATFPSV